MSPSLVWSIGNVIKENIVNFEKKIIFSLIYMIKIFCMEKFRLHI